MPNITDEKLLKAAMAGDTAAIEMLKNRIKTVTLPAFKKNGIQWTDGDVEVLTSEIEERVLNALYQFRFRVSFETWVYRITLNMLLEYQRRVI